MFKRKGKVIAKTPEELAMKEKIRLENESARLYANSIRKTTKKKVDKMNYGYNGKLSFNIIGCYFLWHENNIVYVGESTCIMSRLVQHQKESKKLFDRWTFKKVSGTDIQRKSHERKLIKYYNPKYNITHKVRAKKRKTHIIKSNGEIILF